MWDFWSLSPESLHQVNHPDVGPRPARSTRRTSTATARTPTRFWNAEGERFWVKFHFKTQQGHKHYTNAEGENADRQDPRELPRKPCSARIEKGEFPRWKVQVQIMPEADADKTSYNPFDLTKVWPHSDYPADRRRRHGARTAIPRTTSPRSSRPPSRPRNIVPGIGYSPRQDAAGAGVLLCRRAPLSPRHALRGAAGQRAEVPRASLSQGWPDELLRSRTTGNPDAYYEPNSFGGPAARTPSAKEPPLKISGRCGPL